MAEIVWRATPEAIAQSNIKRFVDALGASDYDDLVQRADSDPEWFWDAAIREMGIRFAKPYDQVVDLTGGVPWAKWCIGGRMNATESLIDCHRGTAVEEKPAIVFEAESGEVRTWSYARLDAETCRLTGALRDLGFGPGDSIGIYMAMVPEVVAAFFAVVRAGCVVVPLFSGFGREAIATRLNDAGATGVISIDVTRRRGSLIDMKAIMDEALDRVPTVRRQVVLNTRRASDGWTAGRDLDWAEITEGQPDDAPAEILDADAPLLLVYTSGTSGKPKGTVLTHCGFLTKMCFDLTVCMDLKASDRMMWISDFGWVVGPMITTTCAYAGATMVLVEGTPDYPEPGRMWRLVQDHKVSFLGVAPTTVRGLMRAGLEEVSKWDLSSIRITGSTGEPWTEEAWSWFFEHVCGRRAPLFNWTGGTEISGGILITTLMHPLKPCAFGGPVPGMGADIFDDAGRPVPPGTVGELVLTVPSIGLTRGLWKDPERYLESYWSTYDNVWRHGDWASRDEDGLWYVHGRSDDTLKIGGKRTGPAEIEGLVMATGRVSEAAAIGLPDPRAGQQVMCVCVAAPGVEAGEAVAGELRDAVAAGLGRAFRPARVVFVPDLPKTRNMKIMRRVVKAAVLGQDPGDLTALVNPEAVDYVREAAGEG